MDLGKRHKVIEIPRPAEQPVQAPKPVEEPAKVPTEQPIKTGS